MIKFPKRAIHEKWQKMIKSPLMKKGFLCLIALVCIKLIVIVIFAIGIYRFHWNGKYADAMIRHIPYPALVMNWRMVSLNSYKKELFMYAKFLESSGMSARFTDEEKKQTVLSKVTKDTLARDICTRYMLSVTKQDMDAKYNEIMGKEADSKKAIEEIYGTSIDDFKQYYIEPLVRLDKMQEHLDAYANKQKKIYGRELVARITGGFQSFEDVAKENSNDPSSASGGDLGFVDVKTRFPELKKEIDALKDGDVSKTLETRTGFHIIKVLERKKPEGSEALDEQTKIQYIFLRRKDAEDWIKESKETAKIWNVIP